MYDIERTSGFLAQMAEGDGVRVTAFAWNVVGNNEVEGCEQGYGVQDVRRRSVRGFKRRMWGGFWCHGGGA